MDFFNLTSEYNNLSNSSKAGLSTLTNFLSFLKSVHKHSEQFVINTKKTLDTFISQFFRDDLKTSLSIHCFEFYRAVSSHYATIISQNSKLNNELIEPLAEYISHINSQSISALNEFKELLIEINNQKKKCDQAKKNYFDSSKAAEEQEKFVIRSIENKEQNKGGDSEISQSHDLLVNLRSVAEENCQKYKTELQKTNQLYEDKNKKYFPILEKIKNYEESKIFFLKFHFDKINRIVNNLINSSNEMYKKISDSVTEIIPENDLKTITEKFNYVYKDHERIPKEEFENYDIYRRNLEAMNKKNQMLLKKENKNNLLPTAEESLFPQNDKSKQSINYYFSKDELSVIDGIFSEKEVDDEKFANLLKKMSIVSYSTNFIDKILENYKKVFMIQIPNKNNFEKLGILLLAIIKNDIVQQSIFEINFAIAFISEKTFYQSEKNPFYKFYLCKLISERCDQIKDKKFWKQMLELKITTELTLKTNAKFKEEINNQKKTQITKDDIPQQLGAIGMNMIKSVIGITGIFKNVKTTEEKAEEKELYQKIYQQFEATEPLRVIRDFITHFSCFNLDSSDIVDILTDISYKYKFDTQQDKLKFIISVINSNMYSVKNSKISSKKDTIDDLLNNDITIQLLDKTFMNKNYLKHQKNKDNLTGILLNSFKYLSNTDYINMLLLNKKYSGFISKAFYKNYLLNKSLPTEIRVKIWKHLLKFNKNKNNYQEIKAKINDDPKLPVFEAIKMDVVRTKFEKDDKENKDKIYYILCSLALSHPNINYCQGMNYIAAFLLIFTKNEEETYNIFNYLLESTDYSDLFANNLKRLNKYFYVFDRLIYIYLPEVFSHLKTQNLSVTYYISPWFITLFTNALSHISDSQNPKILIWIFDLFILEGWKSVIKIGLCLMKHFENKILGLKYDELLHFLVNDILKYDFFQNNNYDKLKKIYYSLKIESGLIENIEKEFEINEKMINGDK